MQRGSSLSIFLFFICPVFLFFMCGRKPQETGKPIPTVSICFTGDVMLDRGVRSQIERIGIDSLFSNVSSIFKKSDYTVINLECPATDTIRPQKKPYVFRAEPEWLPLIRNAGVTHAGLANNHSLDQDEGGLLSTLANLKRYGLVPFGAGSDSTICAPVRFEKSGMTFALFGSAPVFLEYKPLAAEKTKPCIRSAGELASSIRAEKQKHPGTQILVFLHWGKEYEVKPSARQQEAARLLVDAGADAVIGHHPHVLQPVEVYRNKPIFYSLGNLIFDQRDPPTQKGMVVRMVFCADSLQTVELYPVMSEKGVPKRVYGTDPNRPEMVIPDSVKNIFIKYKPERIQP